ncbi:tannase/feruloyl esterase family alpha/beta hydrolase [Acinetobacter baumannii]|uniref:tannase/feruloyl esterase family alpha/beta hydrolase n=1 Tax=Acinetobacter baumannii TaxID=470 RepID=UPI000A3A14D8|nr:tannase/feruloyl esterase family alpha/beta hydrolase [Acinetobacter baumannii]OTT98069.1 tannase/feruloyl esterase family alpha/beta hydrolase [Acinetobacter baumannii]
MKSYKGKVQSIFYLSLISLLLYGCNNSDNNEEDIPKKIGVCDSSQLSKSFSDNNYKIISTQYFKKGELLKLKENTENTSIFAANNVCVVKVIVGPETNLQDKGEPSYSEGIGIEIWLPDPAKWNKRIHVKGGGGWVGGQHRNPNILVGITRSSAGSAADTATVEGAVSAVTDTGHVINNGSFAMNSDGSVNTKLWRDFAERGIHEMAVVSKLLTQQYYGEKQKYAYWNGFSTGGRQGLKEVQINPDDFDGVLAGAPAINWTKFITSELYPQIVMQRDLNGQLLTTEQLNLISNRANETCGQVNGQSYGYILDPSSCKYDPTKDTSILCGTSQIDSCLTSAQASAVNKIWYGQTEDGSVPDPINDNSFNFDLTANQKWFGLTRGTNLARLAGEKPFLHATDLVALIQQDSRIAQSNFINKTSNGLDQWKNLDYATLNEVQKKGIALQSLFSDINTDLADLSNFKNRGGKLIIYHGLADELIMPQGTMRYIKQLKSTMGENVVNSFMQAYFIPGMGHSFANGTANSNANVALVSNDELYKQLTNWVEKGIAPTNLVATSASKDRSLPICLYPRKITYIAGNVNHVNSYKCE